VNSRRVDEIPGYLTHYARIGRKPPELGSGHASYVTLL